MLLTVYLKVVSDKYKKAAEEAIGCVNDARSKHRPFASFHEGYAILLEEVDELWDEVKKKNPDLDNMRKEALQIAACAICFVADLLPKEEDGSNTV